MTWRAEDPMGNEAAKVKHLLPRYTRGRGLDLGCGPFKAYPHFIGVDDVTEYRGWADPRTGAHWRPDVVGDVRDLSMFADGSLDFVFSSHLLEHIDDHEAALSEWRRVIRIGGHLVLYLPHREHYPRMGEEGANPDHRHDFVPADIIAAMETASSAWDLVECETRSGGTEYSFLMVFRRLAEGSGLQHSHRRPRAAKRLLVIRYGAFGDLIMASSILPALKAEGWSITLNCSPPGDSILRHDPHIDEFLVQDKDQVPNEDLGDYWAALGGEYDRVINLCEAVEGTLLHIPGRRSHALPHAARHAISNINYIDMHRMIAGLPAGTTCRPWFYPSGEETAAALAYREKLLPGPIVLWSLAGSSVHKLWPYAMDVIGWLLEQTTARVVVSGDESDQVLAWAIAQALCRKFLDMPEEESHALKLSGCLAALRGHFGHQRLIVRCGGWPIREAMTFACTAADVVVGPETGILNAASMRAVPKVVLLSHSSHENLTRDWLNTIALSSSECPQSPCHRMHYNFDFCPRDEPTGAALCQARITPQSVFDAIGEAMVKARAA